MKPKIATEEEAVRFLKSVKFVLRYGPAPDLPLASMYEAAADKRRAAELTNALLAGGEAIETNVIAKRLVLVHRDIVPALYVLRIRFRRPALSENAQHALQLIQKDGTATAGEVRRFLGVSGLDRPDPADLALTELQQDFFVDRGPSSVPEKGMPYLSKEGFPYRVFDKVHPDIVKAAKKTKVGDAIKEVLEAAGTIPPRKLATMFKLCLKEDEVASTKRSV